MIRLVVVDDHSLFREGMVFMLKQIEGFEVIGEAPNGEVFLELIRSGIKPDVVIMDIAMPGMNGIEATEQLIQIDPDARVLAVSMFSDTKYYHKMVAAGVKGFLVKESSVEELEKAIRQIFLGGTYFSQELLQKIIMDISNPKVNLKSSDVFEITRREEEVLHLICKGYTNREIADQLFISLKTVESHKSSLLEKTQTKNSINLMLFAIKNGLISIETLLPPGKP